MRIYAICVLLLLSSATGCLKTMSRGGWNDLNDKLRYSEREFSAREMKALKSKTAILFLKREDVPRRAAFEAAADRGWTLTPIEVVPFSERAEFADTSLYSHWVINGSERMGVYQFYLALVGSQPDEDGDEEQTGYCRVELHMDQAALQHVPPPREPDDVIPLVYDYLRFSNWTPAHLELYLAAAQRHLEAGHRPWLYEELRDEAALDELREATLYVPDYVLEGPEGEQAAHDESELLGGYPFTYRIVTAAELDDIVATPHESVFLLDYVLSGTDKFVSIYRQGVGIVYRAYESMSDDIDDDDLEIF